MTLIVAEENLSVAWAKAFLNVVRNSGGEIAQLITNIENIHDIPSEDKKIRDLLDNALRYRSCSSCETVASTIFPISMWNPERDADQLYSRYLEALPYLRKSDSRNMYGLYFERMIAFGDKKRNQLEHIISSRRKGNNRRSALQISIFDPNLDHTHQKRRGFPCLQHILFLPEGEDGVSITGIYATQTYFEKAYGNFLGLCYLGRFVAHELGRKLTKMSCIANLALLGDYSKRDMHDLISKLEERIFEIDTEKLSKNYVQVGNRNCSSYESRLI